MIQIMPYEPYPFAQGFFVGWENKPSESTHHQLLANAYKALIAVDTNKKLIVGFCYALSDGRLSCYIPLLEVVASYQHKGIGSQLINTMMGELKDFAMIDLCCDEHLVSFYQKFNFHQVKGMVYRNPSALK